MSEPELTAGEREFLAEAERLVADGLAQWVEPPEIVEDEVLEEWRLRKHVGRGQERTGQDPRRRLRRVAERYSESLDLDDVDLGWLRAVELDDSRDDRRRGRSE